MNFIKAVLISLGGVLFFLLAEIPVMYFLSQVIGQTPFVMAIPAIVSYIVLFCIERNFVAAERISVKEFLILVYAMPELIMIVLSFILLAAAKNESDFLSASGSMLRLTAVATAISAFLRGLAYITSLLIGKFDGENKSA